MCDSMVVQKIRNLGYMRIPSSVYEHAWDIRHENYKVNTPTRFRKHSAQTDDVKELLADLGRVVGIAPERFDFVYFSVCRGAEPHVDRLDPAVFTDTTFVIPIIMPKGKSVITAEDERIQVQYGYVYQFDHTRVHSMELTDKESGCVVAMIAVKRRAE